MAGQQRFGGNSPRGEKKVDAPTKMDKAWDATQRMKKRQAVVDAAKKAAAEK